MDNEVVIALIASSVIFFIYGSISIISLILTFSKKTYEKINTKVELDLFSQPVVFLPVFESKRINWFDKWALKNNRIIGPILIILSLVDLKLAFMLMK